MKDIEQMITDILEREGGFVNLAEDKGGPTNLGVTQAALAEYRGKQVTVEDVKSLTRAEARNIYRNNYLTRHQLHRIHDPYVMCLAFDSAVNHGPQRAVKWLQRAAGVSDDGVFGDVTETAVNSMDAVRLYQRVLAHRVRFYGKIIADDPERKRATADGYKLQAIFAAGWANRAAEFIEDQVT